MMTAVELPLKSCKPIHHFNQLRLQQRMPDWVPCCLSLLDSLGFAAAIQADTPLLVSGAAGLSPAELSDRHGPEGVARKHSAEADLQVLLPKASRARRKRKGDLKQTAEFEELVAAAEKALQKSSQPSLELPSRPKL